ncbi:SDR family NAD(P)-dependent oxidoreductase [Jeongeupia naejangsanensis]|uniref:SDR family NAD(P)-dependent oxidoreductase n=1 Tax=Jeongeupia naejangsanensis TaxID=613195 RepID=A0ABS2BK49_9NEIS|nr:SDR family NAD(P)-dependent oxidoreductase [Jeongeupia naejangsanensis]MBM3115820.1 SDR family NAD(P)-dependent oxidoreductase [Jeongeupia naejangsanensis]
MNRLALITGGSYGLGAALVAHYLAEGWTVHEFSRSGQGYAHVYADFADPDATLATLDTCFAELAGQPWGEIVLINNAAMLTPLLPLAQQTDAQIAANLNVNVMTAARVIAAFLRHFQQVAAVKTVVQISSGAALRGYGSWSLYCAGKAAIDHLLRAVAVEQVSTEHPVTCISIDPDVMDTQMQADIRDTSEADFADVARFIARKEDGKLRTPVSVAAYVAGVIAGGPEGGARYDIEVIS